MVAAASLPQSRPEFGEVRLWGLDGLGFRDLGFRVLWFRDLGFRDLRFRDLGLRVCFRLISGLCDRCFFSAPGYLG